MTSLFTPLMPCSHSFTNRSTFFAGLTAQREVDPTMRMFSTPPVELNRLGTATRPISSTR